MIESEIISLGKFFSAVLWVLGGVIVLVTISYVEFIAYFIETKRRNVLKRKAVKKSFLIGLFFVLIGLFASFVFQAFKPKRPTVSNEVFRFPPARFEGNAVFAEDLISLLSNTTIRSEMIPFEESLYEIKFISRGSPALGEPPRIKMFIGKTQIANFWIFPEYKEKLIYYRSKEKEEKPLIISFINDYVDEKEDRNVWIKSITINRLEIRPDE